MINTGKVTIDCGQKSEHAVNPFVFGHFVEDIRDHMAAMLAFPLRDMDFESESQSKLEVSGSWYAYTNGRNTKYELESPAPRHSGRAQRIRVLSDDEAYAGIAQRAALRGGIDYQVKVVARASIELKRLVVDVVDARSQEQLGQTLITLNGHNWQQYEVNLHVSRNCADAEVRVYIPADQPRWADHVSTGMLWLDHVSLLEADHVAYVKREIIEMTRPLQAGMMRLAGNYISAYHWEHGIGPVLERPVMYNEAWGGWTSKYFGTDEFIAFCRELNVEPLICVNDGSGTPEEAAAWVQYCNGDTSTPMGALRAANGHPEPYQVKYWEIGNEVWGPWQVGTCSAEQFAQRTVAFATAMKAADPSIRLMACGHFDQKWNQPVLEQAGALIEYLTLHIYHGYGPFGMNRHTPAEERYKAIAAFPEFTRHYVQETVKSIEAYPHAAHVQLAITEYNTMYYPNTIRKGLPNEHTLGAAVANAANLNEMLRNSDRIEIGSFSDLVNGWLGGCIRVGDYYADQYCGKKPGWSGKPLEVYGTPTYEVMKLYANRKLHRLLPVETESAVFTVPTYKDTAVALDNLPVLDVVAGTDETGQTVTACIVNRGLEPVTTAVQLIGLEAAGLTVLYEITGKDYDDINDVSMPAHISCQERTVSLEEWQQGVTLQPHSVYAVTFSRKP